MKKNIVWVVVSCLMVVSLVLASCAPAVTEEEEEEVKKEEEEEVKKEEEEAALAAEVPKYGGVFNYALWEPRQVARLDGAFGSMFDVHPHRLINDGIVIGDWTKGPAGTNETTFTQSGRLDADLLIGSSCESWERVEDTLIFHVRKGVHFALDPNSEASRLVGGREVVAEDFAFQLRRLWLSPKSYQSINRAWKKYIAELDGGPWIKATDKYTFEMKCLPGMSYQIYRDVENQWGGCSLVAPELIEKYGHVNSWELMVGTGPFMLVDCIPGASWTFERNPDYWMKDPIGPGKGNQLPYLDGVKLLEMYDASTRLAALRTGKVDFMRSLVWEDMDSLRSSTPELEYKSYPWVKADSCWFRSDKPPLSDIRVRRALLLAFDNPTVLDTVCHGDGYLVTMTPEHPDYRYGRPLDTYPEEIRELYEYHPDKAKELLAEAGYPNGFKTSVVCQEAHADMMSIAAAYWADIGVELEIDVKEYSAWQVITQVKKEHEYMATYVINAPGWDSFNYTRYKALNDFSLINDPQLEEIHLKVEACGWDLEKMNKIAREEFTIRFNELALCLQFPVGNQYVMWWPWLKNYHGELELGYVNWIAWTRFAWIDQDMKEAMVGRR